MSQIMDVLNVSTYTDKNGKEQKNFTRCGVAFQEKTTRLYPETGCSKYDRRLPTVYKKGQTGVLKKKEFPPHQRGGDFFKLIRS